MIHSENHTYPFHSFVKCMAGMEDVSSESIAQARLKLEREDGSSERIKPSLKLWDPPSSTLAPLGLAPFLPLATCLELICGANKLCAVHAHAGEVSYENGTARHQHGRHICGVVCMRTTPNVAVHANLDHMQVCDTARAMALHPRFF